MEGLKTDHNSPGEKKETNEKQKYAIISNLLNLFFKYLATKRGHSI